MNRIMQRETDKERNLLKKAMKSLNTKKAHDKGTNKPAHYPDNWEILFGTPKSIENLRDYITRNDLPSWQVNELTAKIDSMLNESQYNTDTSITQTDDSDEVEIHIHDNYTPDSKPVFQCDKEHFEGSLKTQFNLLDAHHDTRKINIHTPYITEAMEKNGIEENPMSSCMRKQLDKDLDNLMNGTIKTTVEKVKPEQPPIYDPSNVRSHNIGESDYSKHKIQPWDIWEEYNLNPWDADIVKRILRTKPSHDMSKEESRIEDYQKIIHVAQERIRQIRTNGHV